MGDTVSVPIDLLREVIKALLGDPTQGYCTELAHKLEEATQNTWGAAYE